MNLKKFACTALAGAMALSMSATALAADTEVTTAGGTAETKITGSLEAISIKVTVPSTGAVVLNPYRLTVQPDGFDDESQDAILSAAQYIKNESNAAVDIGVTVTGAVSGNAKLATESAEALTTNSVYMYFQLATATDGTTEPTWADYNAETDVLVAAKATKKDAVLQMAAGDSAATYAAFHLAGDMASAPKTPWTSDDKVDVTVAFTFTPVAAEVSGS